MKIKGVIEDLKFLKIKKKKNDSKNSKNISRTLSGVVVSSVGREGTRAVSRSRPSVAETLRAHANVNLFAAPLPPNSMTEQVSLKKCPPPPPCVRAEIRH